MIDRVDISSSYDPKKIGGGFEYDVSYVKNKKLEYVSKAHKNFGDAQRSAMSFIEKQGKGRINDEFATYEYNNGKWSKW